MNLTDNDIVTLLLTTNIGLNNNEIKPLTLVKWNKLIKYITSTEIKEPAMLLTMSDNEIKDKLNLSEDELHNICGLLTRGVNLAFELEKLENKGINILTRSNLHYPKMIKHKLKEKAPAVIFYSGNLDLLRKNFIGIVGSRNVDEEITNNTIKISEIASSQGYCICSGGAKGVDSVAEQTAINSGGGYISFLADSLSSRIKKKEVRDNIETGRCLYLATDGADVRFTVWRAMNRNKYVYSLSKAIVIMNSDYEKGGTWEGAIENLKNKYSIPLAIKNDSKGNLELIKQGCFPLKLDSKIDFNDIINMKTTINKPIETNCEQISIFS